MCSAITRYTHVYVAPCRHNVRPQGLKKKDIIPVIKRQLQFLSLLLTVS